MVSQQIPVLLKLIAIVSFFPQLAIADYLYGIPSLHLVKLDKNWENGRKVFGSSVIVAK